MEKNRRNQAGPGDVSRYMSQFKMTMKMIQVKYLPMIKVLD